jgi:hypothetical protein
MCGHSFRPGHAKTACPGGPVLAEWPRRLQFLVYIISKNALERETITAETPKPGFSEYTDVPIWALLRVTQP